jgi:hypothetical protein
MRNVVVVVVVVEEEEEVKRRFCKLAHPAGMFELREVNTNRHHGARRARNFASAAHLFPPKRQPSPRGVERMVDLQASREILRVLSLKRSNNLLIIWAILR